MTSREFEQEVRNGVPEFNHCWRFSFQFSENPPENGGYWVDTNPLQLQQCKFRVMWSPHSNWELRIIFDSPNAPEYVGRGASLLSARLDLDVIIKRQEALWHSRRLNL